MAPFGSYLKELHVKTGYFATWLPGARIQLGDVGILRKAHQFQPVTSLASLNVQITSVAGSSEQLFEYVSNGASMRCAEVEGGARPAPNLGQLSGTAHVEFSSAHGVLFRAHGCTISQVTDRHTLGNRLRELSEIDTWQSEWHVVVEVVAAKGLTVFVGGETKAKVALQANGTDAYDIADAKVGLRVISEEGVAAKVVADASTTPLYKLAKLRFLGGFREVGLDAGSTPATATGGLQDVHYDHLTD